MNKLGEHITVIALAIVGVAVLAVIVSNQSQTSNVITALGNAFNQSLSAALKPVGTGGI